MTDDNSLSAPKGARIDRLSIRSSGNGMRERNGETQAFEVDLVRAAEVWEKLPGGAVIRKLPPPRPGLNPMYQCPNLPRFSDSRSANLPRSAPSSLEGNGNAESWAEIITALRASFRECEAALSGMQVDPKNWAGHKDLGNSQALHHRGVATIPKTRSRATLENA